jgi:toxin ParE1/3/4
MKVRFARPARADLRSIIASIAKDNPKAARRYGKLLADRALSLSDFPNRGALLRGHATARRLVVSPYLIIYRPDRDLVRILRILHGARDIDALLPRDSHDEREPET